MKQNKTFINREISWLSFNERVLQEAADPVTPLIERIKFLGIFSSNLDEFFRVRVASVKRLVLAGKKVKALIGDSPEDILSEIQSIVLQQQKKFNEVYKNILHELETRNIFIVDEKHLSSEQETYVRHFFREEVRPTLVPVMLENIAEFPVLKDHAIYLAVCLKKSNNNRGERHAIIEVPTDVVSRFLVLPKMDDRVYVMLLDDVIRLGLKQIFSMFKFDVFHSFTIKLTRDAELDIDDDITTSFFEKMSKSLKQRKKGSPVRFIYDSRIPKDFLKLLTKKNRIISTDALIPGDRYHNFKDFMSFPRVGSPDMLYENLPPLPHKDIKPDSSLFNIIRKKDILLHFPYHSFHYVIDLLREAAIDPKVVSIKMTLYRVAKNSNIINTLIRAARNGKSVTVVMELQARFDEAANIYWTDKLREEGVTIIHGVPNLKVHSKLCLIRRKEKRASVYYANIGTGNFNENTARIYSDHSLFTSDIRITKEIKKVFDFFENNYKTSVYSHLVISPFTTRKKLNALISKEMKNAGDGKKAYIIVKANSLVDSQLIEKLYEASNAGVKIDLIIRGQCSLIPGVKGMSENITAISIVDRFLEHSRIFVFCNDGDEQYYISSCDWMNRNLDRRIEATCPIYDKKIQGELRDFLNIQLSDNTKARILNEARDNAYKKEPGKPPVRAQIDFYNYLKEINKKHGITVIY